VLGANFIAGIGVAAMAVLIDLGAILGSSFSKVVFFDSKVSLDMEVSSVKNAADGKQRQIRVHTT
jgi:hypothetical protein